MTSLTRTAYHSYAHPHSHTPNAPQAEILAPITHPGKNRLHAPIPTDPFEESVYSLIPKEIIAPEKGPMYRSKFSSQARQEYKSNRKSAASMGPVLIGAENPKEFLKKRQGIKVDIKPVAIVKKPVEKKNKQVRKESLPKDTGKLSAPQKKDYIKINALEIINSVPQKIKKPGFQYRQKEDFGKVPEYLSERKNELHEAVLHIEKQQQERQTQAIIQTGLLPLPESERAKILDGLRANYDKLNLEYQKLSLTVDTLPKITRKVNMEEQLKKLEQDIKRFSNTNIFVNYNHH